MKEVSESFANHYTDDISKIELTKNIKDDMDNNNSCPTEIPSITSYIHGKKFFFLLKNNNKFLHKQFINYNNKSTFDLP